MLGLTRWNEARGINRLHRDMEDLFDRFSDREDWMPGRMMRSLRSFQRDLDELFGDFFGSDWAGPAGSEQAGAFWPRVETSLTDGEHIVRAELPGFTPENVEVNVTGNTLTLRGERKTGSEEKGDLSHRRFSHTLILPEAVEEGIVPGGGVDKVKPEGDEKIGVDIVRRGLEEPLRMIARNAAWEGPVVLGKVRDSNGDFGFNAETERYEDLVSAGIIDPTKIVRSALENAASIAGLMVTTECLVIEAPEKKEKPAAPTPPEDY
jgi:HSP20 family molecular chaperone IbpA